MTLGAEVKARRLAAEDEADEAALKDLAMMIRTGSFPFQVDVEAGFSASTHTDHKAMMGQLDLFPRFALTPTAEERAREAQGRLAAVGHHRMAPIDIMIAACAHEAGVGVLHYDRDYDLIAEHTGLRFESVWLAPAGSL